MEFDELTGHGEAEVVLDQTPFYAEGGGQVGDQGVLREPGGGSELFTVSDTQKPVGGLIVHRGAPPRPSAGRRDGRSGRRRRTGAHSTMRNHTATHLLHRALRNVVGERARQAGSLVTPDYLRFDFPLDRGVTDDELRAIEDEVHRIIRDDRPVSIAFMSMAEAIEGGADAFFDEKYGEQVRTIRVQDYSFELCGGTHCRATGQIGGFLITGERSIGSGMRRIEAVTGVAADALVRERFDRPRASRRGARRAVGRRRRGSDRRAPGRAPRDEAPAQGGGGAGLPKPGDLAAGRSRSPRASGSSPRRLPYDSMDALKARRARPQRRCSVRASSRWRSMQTSHSCSSPCPTISSPRASRPGTLSAPRCRPLEGRGGGRPAMAQGRGTRREGLDDALAAIRARLETGA